MTSGQELIGKARQALNLNSYHELHWTGTFAQYLDLIRQDPQITRSAFERIYDMVLSYGTREYLDSKKKIVHYNFFDDPQNKGADGIYGLDIQLMKMINIFKSAARRYGTYTRNKKSNTTHRSRVPTCCPGTFRPERCLAPVSDWAS